MNDRPPSKESEAAEIADEVRARRLVVVNDDGEALAVISVKRGVVELRLGGTEAPCNASVYAGQDEEGGFTAGVELLAHGDSVGGGVLMVRGTDVDFERFE